jgi:alkylhydroperoxidase family enzyme
MGKCTAITRGGDCCRGVAIEGSDYCYAHHPDHEQDRRQAARKGGKRGGRGRPSSELARLQRRFEELAEGVLSGKMDRAAGAVAGQLLNGARACVRDGMSAREQEELVERMEELEAGLRAQKESRYGA